MMPYVNFTELKVPRHIENCELNFENLDEQKFLYYINGYLESFQQLSEDNFWKCEILTNGFVEAYKLETLGSELIIIAEFDKYYFSFVYQSID